MLLFSTFGLNTELWYFELPFNVYPLVRVVVLTTLTEPLLSTLERRIISNKRAPRIPSTKNNIRFISMFCHSFIRHMWNAIIWTWLKEKKLPIFLAPILHIHLVLAYDILVCFQFKTFTLNRIALCVIKWSNSNRSVIRLYRTFNLEACQTSSKNGKLG